jgi:hypothetical protein
MIFNVNYLLFKKAKRDVLALENLKASLKDKDEGEKLSKLKKKQDSIMNRLKELL